MTTNILVRTAAETDLPDITRIYNYAIKHTTATFDIEPKSIEDRCNWLYSHSDDHPLIVAVIDDRVVGWAELKPFGTRKAYEHTVEDAVYVDCNHQGRGIGSALLARLLDIASERRHHAVLSLIVGGNNSSIRLHEKFSFELVGRMREVGRKFDQWLDILIYERSL